MDWEQILKSHGLGMDRAKPNWLVYGHEHGDKTDHGDRQVAAASKYGIKKRLKPRQKIKQLVWGETTEQVATPDWGFAGGYTPEGKLIRATPHMHKDREIKERRLCSNVATKTRSKKSSR